MPNVTTGACRASYVHLFQKHAFDNQTPSYSIRLLMPKTDTDSYNALINCYQQTVQQGIQTKWGGKQPAKLGFSIYDGDQLNPHNNEPFGPECAGHWVINTRNTTSKPTVVDTNHNAILDEGMVYPGCWVRASLSMYPYSASGNNGIGIGVEAVQFLQDGEPFANGPVDTQQVFAAPVQMPANVAAPAVSHAPQQPMQAPQSMQPPQQQYAQPPMQQPMQAAPQPVQPMQVPQQPMQPPQQAAMPNVDQYGNPVY